MPRTLTPTLTLLLAGGLAGCVEYELPQDLPVYPASDAPPLAAREQTDAFLQSTTPVVDILFTIDNSCSMEDEQAALAANFPSFIQYFEGSGLDYHIGVVSTDLFDPSHSGRLRTAQGVNFIAPDTPDAEGVFTEMASMSTEGAGVERGLGATWLALEGLKNTFNAGFRRDNAEMHTIVISDEEDQTLDTLISEDEFISWYGGLTVDARDRSFSSIVKLTGLRRGTTYLEVTDAIGGITWSIDAGEWGQVLDMLGVQASGVKHEFFLSQLPLEGTIEVEVEDPTGTVRPFYESTDEPPVDGWTYDRQRNSVSFVSYIPEDGARIVIRYTLLSSLVLGGD
ncbi:MAG: hypothetical protein R3F59_21375 [Myxococcota bacterium]